MTWSFLSLRDVIRSVACPDFVVSPEVEVEELHEVLGPEAGNVAGLHPLLASALIEIIKPLSSRD